jgi:hypothetical protein
MNTIRIIGIYPKEGFVDGVQLQHLLSKYGGVIRTRLGLHEVVDDHARPGGLIILELDGVLEEIHRLENELFALHGVDIQKMEFQK